MKTYILMAVEEIVKEPQLFLDLDKAGLSRKTQPGQLGFSWDEGEHPREPAGSAKGGEFKKKDTEDTGGTGGAVSSDNSASGQSKPLFEELLFDDTYTGPRFTYGGQFRPLGHANIPKGWIIQSQRPHEHYRHGTVDYPHELTPHEAASAELERVYHPGDKEGLTPEQFSQARRYIHTLQEPPEGWNEEVRNGGMELFGAAEEGPVVLRQFLETTRGINPFSRELSEKLGLGLSESSAKETTTDANPSLGPPKKFTKETPVWQMGESAYLSVHGVHQPWIAEISPMQIGNMSERQKAKYQAKRAEEWGTASRAKEEWHQAVVAAHDRGEFTTSTEGVHPEAKTAILHEGIRREKTAVENAADRLRQSNQITSPDQVNVGDRVYNLMRNQYGTVTDKRRGRLFVQPEGSTGFLSQPFTGMAREFSWKNYNDLQAAAKEQATRKSLVVVVQPEPRLLLKGGLFEEEEHPREPEGAQDAKYKPGEFIPKGESAPASERTDALRGMKHGDVLVMGAARVSKIHGLWAIQVGGKSRWGKTPEEAASVVEREVGQAKPVLEEFGFRNVDVSDVPPASLDAKLEMTRETFKDMADLIGLDPGQLGFSGKLSLRIGKTQKGTLGTYNPLDRVLEVASENGTGSLSHEWFHAFDHNSMVHFDSELSEKFPWTLGTEKLESLPASAAGEAMGDLIHLLKTSDIQRRAGELDKTNKRYYYSILSETAARAFEGYLLDKMADKGMTSPHLVHRMVADTPDLWGTPEERKEINAAFDKLWAAVREDKALLKSLRLLLSRGCQCPDCDSLLTTGEAQDGRCMGCHEAHENAPRRAAEPLGMWLPSKVVDDNPVLLLKAKPQPGQLGFGFDAAQHPREPSGSSKGGEFAKKPAPEYKGGALPKTTDPNYKANGELRKPKILGVNDDVTVCEKCGKPNLKKTVVLDYGIGEPVHYGSDCAAAALYGSKSGKNRAKVDLEAEAVEYALRRMKETGDPSTVADEIQGQIGYGRVGMTQGGLDVGDIHIREDGTVGEPVGPIMTPDLLTRIQNMVRIGRYTDEQIAEMRGATLSQVRRISRSLKRTHEPLGGHMASHVPVGHSSPVTETPVGTQDFRQEPGLILKGR